MDNIVIVTILLRRRRVRWPAHAAPQHGRAAPAAKLYTAAADEQPRHAAHAAPHALLLCRHHARSGYKQKSGSYSRSYFQITP